MKNKKRFAFLLAFVKMVVLCIRCMGFKKLYKSACKKCKNKRRGESGRDLGKMFKKAKKLTKKAMNSDLGKLVISQGLAYAPKIYNMGTSKIKKKRIKQLLQSNTAKRLLNKGIDKAYSKL